MKQSHLIIVAGIVLAALSSCNSSGGTGKQDVSNFTEYVDSVENNTSVYSNENWIAINNGYKEREEKAEKALPALDAEAKAKTEDSKVKYAAFKAEYELKLKGNEVAASPEYKKILRDRLFGEGKVGADMQLGFVTAANVLDVYKNFVNTVADN